MVGWYVIGGFAALSVLLWCYAQAVRWLWVPLRSKGRTWSAVRPTRVALSDAELTPDQRAVLDRLTAAFAGAGFGPPTTFGSDAVANASGIQRTLFHPATGDAALVIIAVAKHTRNVVFAVRSEFADGRRISTGVNRSATVFPPNPADDSANFPWVRDVPTVLEAHRRRVDRAGRLAERRASPGPDEVERYMDAAWDREHAWWVRCGYRYVDAAAGRYRPTWKGAYLSAWKMTPPVRGWRARRRDRRARRLWRELGMDVWHPPAAEPVAALPVPADDDPSDPAGTPLRYEAALAPGVLRQHRAGDTVTVRLGAATAGQVLRRQWGRLLSAVVLTGLLCLTGSRLWTLWQMWAMFPSRFRWTLFHSVLRRELMLVLLWAGLLALNLWRVGRAVRNARGAITLVASPAGLQFENLPGRRAAGFWPREDVQGLTVAVATVGLRGKRYRLDVRPADADVRRLTLLHARDPAVLQSVRRSIVQAMGMAEPAQPPAADPPG